MKILKFEYPLSFGMIAIGIALSTYLLFHHLAMSAGQMGQSDLCSLVFGKSCSGALFSSYSALAGIPLGGWGMIYFIVLGLFVGLSRWLSSEIQKEMIQTAFWVVAVGISFSIFYLLKMFLNPMLLCPFCVVIHVCNIGLFFLVKRMTQISFKDLIKGLLLALQFVVLGKREKVQFSNWNWLPFIMAILIVLVMYQWVRIQGLNINLNRLASYDPLEELIKFDAQTQHKIALWGEEPVLGDHNAPVSMVVFSDFQCSMCAIFSKNLTDLIDFNEGSLNIRFKYFPLSTSCNPIAIHDIHPLACEAARAAQAAHYQGKFWQYHDSLFNQNLNGAHPDLFFKVAESIGLDMEQFRVELASESCKNKVSQDVNEALGLKLDATPCVFLNGRQVYDLRPENLNFLIRYLSRNSESEELSRHRQQDSSLLVGTSSSLE